MYKLCVCECSCMCAHVHTHHSTRVKMREHCGSQSVLFHYGDSQNWIWVMRLGSKRMYLLWLLDCRARAYFSSRELALLPRWRVLAPGPWIEHFENKEKSLEPSTFQLPAAQPGLLPFQISHGRTSVYLTYGRGWADSERLTILLVQTHDEVGW